MTNPASTGDGRLRTEQREVAMTSMLVQTGRSLHLADARTSAPFVAPMHRQHLILLRPRFSYESFERQRFGARLRREGR
ncbi:MAG: hypothetical protein QOD10_1844 [Mycobacterium sp.]|jgi:hypothetical protein|nr:hypothetical protein [Mycobacterium sp.]